MAVSNPRAAIQENPFWSHGLVSFQITQVLYGEDCFTAHWQIEDYTIRPLGVVQMTKEF